MGKIRIISKKPILFENREEAGRSLGLELKSYTGKNAVVAGIPRGGIVVANEVARQIGGDLDIFLSRKLRTPGRPELAMGAITEDGRAFINETVVRDLSIDNAAIDLEKSVQLEELSRRSSVFRKIYARVPLSGRVVIVTDDGVATGATVQAAIWAILQAKPQYLIAAVPVGAEETIMRLAKDVDEMICLYTPPFFTAVGQFYKFFEQIEDRDVIKILTDFKANSTTRGLTDGK